MSVDIHNQALLTAVVRQRNDGLDALAHAQADIAVLKDEIRVMSERLEELESEDVRED